MIQRENNLFKMIAKTSQRQDESSDFGQCSLSGTMLAYLGVPCISEIPLIFLQICSHSLFLTRGNKFPNSLLRTVLISQYPRTSLLTVSPFDP